jgi:hypothetical protein
MLRGNTAEFIAPSNQSPEPYVALRLLAGLLSVLAVVVLIAGGLIAIVGVLASLGSAGAAARFAPAPVAAGILGAGLVGGLIVALATIFCSLLLWAWAQAIRVLLSIEGHAREAAALQRAMLAELRHIGSTSPPPH